MELDTRGEECPLPTARAVDEMRRVRDGGSTEPIVVLTDDAICAEQIPSQAQALGFTVDSERSAQEWRITLRAPGAPASGGTQDGTRRSG